MDLGTVKEQLCSGYYKNLSEFKEDMERIIQNSKTYNTYEKSKVSDSIFLIKILCTSFAFKFLRNILIVYFKFSSKTFLNIICCFRFIVTL